MSKIKKFANTQSLKSIYYATIYPHLTYGISCWGGVPISRRETLIKLQKRSIRYISKSPRLAHTSDLFFKLNILKLQEVYTLRVSIIMYQINFGSWIGDLNMKKITTIHNYETRLSSNENYCNPQVSTNMGKNSFTYVEPKVWAGIDIEVKKLPLKEFKKTFAKTLIEQYKLTS